MPMRIQLAQRLRVLSDSARRLAITLVPSSARGGGRGGGCQGGGFRQLKKHVFQRLLRDTQLANVDPVGHKPPVDRRRLRGVDGQDEGAVLDTDLLRFEQRLEQSASLV